MKHLDNLEKIDHTICLNFNRNKGFKFGIDKLDHADCKDFEEFDKCYTDVLNVVDSFEILKKNLVFRLTKVKVGSKYTPGCYLEINNTQNNEVMMIKIKKEEYETLRKVL